MKPQVETLWKEEFHPVMGDGVVVAQTAPTPYRDYFDATATSAKYADIDGCQEALKMGNDMIFFNNIWRLGRKEKKDEVGRIHYVDGTMKTPESLKDIWYPDSDLIRKRLDDLFNAIEGTEFGVVSTAPSAGFIVTTAMGYESFCMQTLMAPEFILEFQKRIHEYTLNALDMYLEYPIDVIQLGSGLHTSTGTMLSPEHMETFEYSYLREQAKIIKDRGRLLMFHIDGYAVPIIPMLLEIGMDILNPIEAGIEGQDIYEIKQRYGEQLALR